MKIHIGIILLPYCLISLLTIIFFNGTGDGGDSILHYLFAKYAPIHTELYFNHWAKPLYVLLASPFAQFGFTGIKIFNALISIATVYLTFKTTEKLNIKNEILAPVFLIFTPLYYILVFSGLTEPLFSLFTIGGTYLILNNKTYSAVILISFLPFVRSEGLILAGVFSVYLLMNQKWKYIPLMLTGHVIYSIAGFFVYDDFLWVFTKIPYASLGSPYGSGEWNHFIIQFLYVAGVPLYGLFWLGIIKIIWDSIKRKISPDLFIIVFGGFMSCLIAHSAFWYFGIFNSMGLKRVLLGVAPFSAIISLIGFNFITESILENKRNPKLIFQSLLLFYIMVFPFTSNPAAINRERDLMLSKDQQTAKEMAAYLSKNEKTNQRFIFSHPYLSEVLDVDYFDKNKRLEFTSDNLNVLKKGDIIIWENWFAVVENGISKEQLDLDSTFTHLHTITALEKTREIIYSVYVKK